MVDGPPHPELEGISLWISEGVTDGIRTFMTSGGEVVERDDTRLRLVFALTHEGFTIGDPMYWLMDEPIHIELDLPYTTCED